MPNATKATTARPASSGRTKKKKKHRRKPRSRFQRWLLRWGWIFPVGAILLGGAILAATYMFATIPLPRDINFLSSSAEVFDRNGNPIGTFSNEVRRFLIDTSELPEYVGQAVVASEDRDFYKHNGVSMRGIARAGWANLTGGQISQGGSTITQQYIKNAVLTSERTLTRKVKEAILAIKLERAYSKAEILGFYLNTIYLGRGAYGIEAAARTYFDKHATELTLGEAAYLGGIVPSPEAYQLDRNREGAIARRDRALDLMEAQGYISSFRTAQAKRQELRLSRAARQGTTTQKAAYFIEWIRRDFLSGEYKDCLFTCGLKIYTTLDPEMQASAELAVSSTLTEPEDPEAALVSMTPRGEVRAFVGGRTFRNVEKARGFNYAADIGRQPGSSLKPFTLLAAIENGISPDSSFSGSSPKTIEDERCETNGVPWRPENYGGGSYGTVTLDQATTNSINTVYAQLITEVGPDKVADLLTEFGFDPPPGLDEIPPRCSLALGGSELDVTAVEMARAYAGFAGRGRLPSVNPIRYITDSQGNCLKEYLPQKDIDCEEEADHVGAQVVDQNSADVLNEILTHVVEGGTATAADVGRPVAGKTGTTQNNGNAWFAGYTPQLATVVWMGYPLEKVKGGEPIVPLMSYCADPVLCRPVHGIEVTGGSFPAQIWASYMSAATADMEVLDFVPPTEEPERIINSPPPYTPEPSPSYTLVPVTPTPTPTLDPTPTEPPPGIVPTPTVEPEPKEEKSRSS